MKFTSASSDTILLEEPMFIKEVSMLKAGPLSVDPEFIVANSTDVPFLIRSLSPKCDIFSVPLKEGQNEYDRTSRAISACRGRINAAEKVLLKLGTKAIPALSKKIVERGAAIEQRAISVTILAKIILKAPAKKSLLIRSLSKTFSSANYFTASFRDSLKIILLIGKTSLYNALYGRSTLRAITGALKDQNPWIRKRALEVLQKLKGEAREGPG